MINDIKNGKNIRISNKILIYETANLTHTMILDLLAVYGLADPLLTWSNTDVYPAILTGSYNFKN